MPVQVLSFKSRNMSLCAPVQPGEYPGTVTASAAAHPRLSHGPSPRSPRHHSCWHDGVPVDHPGCDSLSRSDVRSPRLIHRRRSPSRAGMRRRGRVCRRHSLPLAH
eukprot:2625389-Rhodomonas_salina.1